MAKKLKGKITISRPQGGDTPTIRIEVVETLSRVEFLEIELDPATMMDALTGRGYASCDLTVRGLDRVGMTRETKYEDVLVPRDALRDSEAIQAAVAVHEVDGWIGRLADAQNSHRRVKEGSTDTHSTYRVFYYRHVNPEEG